MSSKQLSLLLDLKPHPSFKNFVIGKNAELIQSLKDLCSLSAREHLLYVWGERGVGKSHLLLAVKQLCLQRSLSCILLKGEDEFTNTVKRTKASLLIIDNVHRLTDKNQHVLFNWYNEFKDNGGTLLVAGNIAPPRLPLRQDLLTRLSWGLVYRVHALTDDEKFDAMMKYSRELGFTVSKDVVNYVLRRNSRDLSYLLNILDGLDYYSLDTRRRVTVPLVKEFFAVTDSLSTQNPDKF